MCTPGYEYLCYYLHPGAKSERCYQLVSDFLCQSLPLLLKILEGCNPLGSLSNRDVPAVPNTQAIRLLTYHLLAGIVSWGGGGWRVFGSP